MNPVRDRLEDQIGQVDRDLAEVDAQLGAGELDPETAARLRATYRHERERIENELASIEDAPRESSRRSGRRVLLGAGLMIAGAVAVTVLVVNSVEDRPPGGFATGGVVTDVVESGGVDLSEVTNEQLEEVVAANPGVVPMRRRLAERYFEAGDFSKALEHYLIVLESGPDAQALANIGWMTYLSQEPEIAESYVERALDLEPVYPQAQWYLANIRLLGLADADGAIAPLEAVLATDGIPDEIRDRAEELLAEARQAS